MEDKKINEQESLELIAQMIRQTKDHLNVGSGNAFLIWGYTCVIVSLIVYAICTITGVGTYSLLYLCIPVTGTLLHWNMNKRNAALHGTAKSYTTKVIDKVWAVVGYTFALAALSSAVYYFKFGSISASIFFILGFLMPSFGCTVTGIVLKDSRLKNGGFLGILSGLALCNLVINGHEVKVGWCLIMALCYLLMMVIPGHCMNYKARKEQEQSL